MPFLVHRQTSTTLIADNEMADENIRDQFVTVHNLARLLAKDRSFVSEVGLDEFPPDQVVLGLEGIIGFILAMYNSAKTIFSAYRTLTLDEKFTRLIYSRFVLYPNFSQRPLTLELRDELDSDALNYAEECYEEIKRNADQSQSKWDDLPLSTKFFEICVRVLIEEDIVDTRKLTEEEKSQSTDFFHPVDSLFGSRPVLAVAFKGVFSRLDWELGGKIESIQVSQNRKDKNDAPSQLPKWFRDMVKWLDSGNELSEDYVTAFLGRYSTYLLDERDDLKGLHLISERGVDIVIQPLKAEIKKYGLTEDAVKTTVELRLRKHGIKVCQSPRALHIIVNTYVDEDFNCTAINVLVELLRPAVLLFNPKVTTNAVIWSKSHLNLAPLDEITAVMTGVQILVDEFINDYQAANPKE